MSTPTEIHFVRQKHDAKRAGLHFDYRVVIGDKAFSWASRKEFPEVGKPTILWHQPVHHAAYLNNPDITIPDGQYGAGTQVIDYAQKGNALVENDAYHLELNNGDRFLIKKAPDTYGEKAWLFLRKKKLEDKKNPYLEKVAAIQNSDMRFAFREVNDDRTKRDLPLLTEDQFMEEFPEHRPSVGRVTGAIVGSIVGTPLIGGPIGYFIGKSSDNSTASKNIVNHYLKKEAALGNSDMVSARSQVNKKREESGKSEIGYHEFKEQFKDRRGVSRRVVGTLGLANVGAMLNRYNPAAGALVGAVGGYYLGKSFDNKNARKNMVKEAAEKKRDDIHGWKRAGVVGGTFLGTAAAVTPGSVYLARKAFGGESSGKVTDADVSSYVKSKNLRHVTRGGQGIFDSDMTAHYKPSGMSGSKRPYVHAKGPEAALHEYGHAHSSNVTRRTLGKAGFKAKWTGIALSQNSLKGVGAIAGAYAATSDNEKARKYAPVAVAAATTPLLVEEARATLSPAKHLYKTKGKAAAGALLKKLGPAYGTYALAAGSAVGAASWAKHIKNKAITKANKGK